MADSWIEELERLGLAWRIRSSPDAAVTIVSSRAVEVLPPDEAASAAQSLVSDPLGSAVTSAGLRGQPLSQAELWSDASAIAEGLLSGKLVAFRVRSTSGITAGEAAAIEALLANHSMPAPPPTRPPPKPDTPLHKYTVCVKADTGKPITGVKLKLEIEDTPRMATTGANGTATVEWFSTARASLRLLEQEDLETQLAPLWSTDRCPSLPSGPNVWKLPVGAPFPELSTPADGETTVVIERPPTWIEFLLLDQNRQPVPNCDYELLLADGTRTSGSTDEDGLIRGESSIQGTCTLTLPDWSGQPAQGGQPVPLPTLPGPVPGGGAPNSARDYWVQNQFVDAQTGKPIPDLEWRVEAEDGTIIAEGTTGEDGMVRCEVPDAGNYRIVYEEPCEAPEIIGDTETYPEAVQV